MSISYIIGLGLYILVVLFALSGLIYIWNAFRSGASITHIGLCQWGLSFLYSIIFGYTNIYKIHLLWVIPVGFLISFTQRGMRFGNFVGVLLFHAFGKK